TGSGYKLQASSAGLSSGTSGSFAVTDRFVVTTQPPSSVTAGNSFGLVPTPHAAVLNIDTSFSGNVTVADANALTPLVGGTVTVQAVNGVADFSQLLTQDMAGSHTLKVTSGLTTVTTNPFTVTADTATKLAPPAAPVG